jgi:uncharacterized membrane protein YbhN (UPF0104 family)
LGGVEPERLVELDDLVAPGAQSLEDNAGARMGAKVVRAESEDAQEGSSRRLPVSTSRYYSSLVTDVEAVTEPARGDRRRTVIGVVLIALIVVAAALAIYHQRHSFIDSLDKLGAGAMIGSFAVALLGVALTFFIWREVLQGLEVDMPWRIGARAFFTSQLGKYLPGSVWPVLVQMEAGKARGASRRTMLAANLITIVLSCAVGLILASALLPISDTRALSHYWWLLLLLPFLIALLHPRALPWVLDRLFALMHRPSLDERLPVRNTVRAAGWSVGSFVFQGLHIAILALTLGGGGFSTVLLCIGGMSLAVSAGVLFIPAPAGAGVRDVILTLVLRATLSGGQALAVVVASRALLIVADLCLAALAATTLRRQN